MSKEMLIFLSSGRYQTLNKNHYCGILKTTAILAIYEYRNDHTSQKSSPIYMPSLLRKHTIHWISEIKKFV